MNLKLDTFAPTQIYHLMTQTVVPRLIAWALTESVSSRIQFSAFLLFHAHLGNPAATILSVGKKPSGEIKDTTAMPLKRVSWLFTSRQPVLPRWWQRQQPARSWWLWKSPRITFELVEFEGFSTCRSSECAVALADPVCSAREKYRKALSLRKLSRCI